MIVINLQNAAIGILNAYLIGHSVNLQRPERKTEFLFYRGDFRDFRNVVFSL